MYPSDDGGQIRLTVKKQPVINTLLLGIPQNLARPSKNTNSALHAYLIPYSLFDKKDVDS